MTFIIVIDLLILCEPRCLHEVVGREEAGNHGVIESAVHVDDFQVRVVLVAGETSGKAEGSRQVAGQCGGVEYLPISIAFHITPWVEMDIADYPLAAVGDVRVAAQTVGVDIVHAVHIVASHADGGETGYLRVSHVFARIFCQSMCLVREHFSLTEQKYKIITLMGKIQ